MTTPDMELEEMVTRVIHEKEIDQDHELTAENKAFLQCTVVNLITAAITKYITGSKEHGDDFLYSVDHIGEMAKEQIDSIFYTQAALRKLRNFDERYK